MGGYTNAEDGTPENALSGLLGVPVFRHNTNDFDLAKDIFKKSRENSPNEKQIVDEFINNLGLSLSLIINIIDPDAIVFGGGVSNEIQSLEEIKIITEKYLSEFNNIKKVDLKTVFLKPKYGDASGVRGAAILNRQNLI